MCARLKLPEFLRDWVPCPYRFFDYHAFGMVPALGAGRAPECLAGVGRGSRHSTGIDRAISALGMGLFTLSVGYAINLTNGLYDGRALLWLTISLLFCIAAVALQNSRKAESLSQHVLALALAVGIVVEMLLLMARRWTEPWPSAAIVGMSLIGLLQLFDLRRLRIPLILITSALFFYAGVVVINLVNDPGVDVYTWQQHTSVALMDGRNPYELRLATNRWGTRFYAPGVVDQNGNLTCAFPYPPLSLLMVLPGFLLGGDIRYAQLAAIAISAVLMAMARPGSAGRIGALVGVLFLLTPRVFYLLWTGWTEPLVVLNFSLVMFCACRWRKGLPWALGLFFATKQYTVLALPLLPLLVQGPERWKELRAIVMKAGIVVAVINLPFLLWNVHEFTRAVLLLQVVPPFRTDALSYLVWIYSWTGTKPPMWIPSLPVTLAIALSLWRVPRSPAGFAGALTLVTALCFAFNKQAFCNYYYFTIATACWSIAATTLPLQLERPLVATSSNHTR